MKSDLTLFIQSALQNNFETTLWNNSLPRWQDKLGSVNFIQTLDEVENQNYDLIFTNYLTIDYTRNLVESVNLENKKIIKIANSYDRNA